MGRNPPPTGSWCRFSRGGAERKTPGPKKRTATGSWSRFHPGGEGAQRSTTFDIDREFDTYLSPAKQLAERGHKVVVFGHTHLPKVVELGGDRVCLNTATWADLMRVPESAYTRIPGDKHDAKALAEVDGFVLALRDNDIASLRRQLPTYARIELSPEGKFAERGYSCSTRRAPDGALSTAEVSARLRTKG